jgi:hypothetical protein
MTTPKMIVSKLGLYYVVILNKWDKQTKQYSYLGAICANKLKIYIIKDFIVIGMKLVCGFS